MAWRLAHSLDTLRNQVNTAYPNRNKASDGTIGDAAHAGTASDHNPNSAGVVCAMDLTHDPANFDAHAFAEHIRTHRHPNLKYVISKARIAGAWSNWQWTPNSGHFQHVHISVGLGNDGQSRQPYDDTIKWNIKGESMDYSMTPTQLDIMYKGIMGEETPADVLSNPDYLKDWRLAEATFWNNGGEARFKASQQPKVECTQQERQFLDLRKQI